MEKILNKYTIEDLKNHYDDNTLQQLHSIGKKTEKLIIDYFNNNNIGDYIKTRISNITKFNVTNISDYFNIEENCNLFNSYINWLNELQCSKRSKEKIINKWLSDINNNYKSWVKDNNIITNKDNKNKNLLDKHVSYIIEYWANQSINNNWYTPDNIENDPMILKELDFKFEKIDEIALENNWWNINDYYRFEYYIEYILEKKTTTSSVHTRKCKIIVR